MNNIILQNGLNAARKVWNDPSVSDLTLASRIAYVHEQVKRHTHRDYKDYSSLNDYVDTMIEAINEKCASLKIKNLDKAAYRDWLLIQDPDGLLYTKAKFEDMYNNHI
ncbi:MAG: hypothetical protein K5923_05815 [Clostridia bacterium]|nr:hypothetical protein [Clostridia bacterium]